MGYNSFPNLPLVKQIRGVNISATLAPERGHKQGWGDTYVDFLMIVEVKGKGPDEQLSLPLLNAAPLRGLLVLASGEALTAQCQKWPALRATLFSNPTLCCRDIIV